MTVSYLRIYRVLDVIYYPPRALFNFQASIISRYDIAWLAARNFPSPKVITVECGEIL